MTRSSNINVTSTMYRTGTGYTPRDGRDVVGVRYLENININENVLQFMMNKSLLGVGSLQGDDFLLHYSIISPDTFDN